MINVSALWRVLAVLALSVTIAIRPVDRITAVAGKPVSLRQPAPTQAVPTHGAKERLLSEYGALPLSFELNRGQAKGNVRFLAHGNGYTLLLTPAGAMLAIAKPQKAALRLPGRSDPRAILPTRALGVSVFGFRFVGANTHATIVGSRRLAGTSNYFVGSDPDAWRTDIPNFGRVVYRGLYPGIDLVYHGHAGRLEYDLDLKPGADPHAIKLAMVGAERAHLDTQGNLHMTIKNGDVRQARPIVYQLVKGRRRLIASHYAITHQHIGIVVGTHDQHAPLVIDPVLDYSTYVGGSSLDYANGIGIDSAGNAYIAGLTWSADFPTTTGAYSSTSGGGMDVFVTKLNASGTGGVYSTYLGGPSVDAASGIAVDSAGDAYVTGVTNGSFPTTAGAAQSTFGGINDGFVTKLNPSGNTLLYSTYLGGSSFDNAIGIAIDGAGSAYLTGYTLSTDFPITNSLQSTLPGLVSGFVTKLNATGSAFLYSTFLGGNQFNIGEAVAVDGSGHAYVTGATNSFSNTIPITNAVQATPGGGSDAFVTELTPAGNGLVFSTLLGGNGTDEGLGITVGSLGGIYVTGVTNSISNTFPITNAMQATPGGGFDAFVTKLYPSGAGLVYRPISVAMAMTRRITSPSIAAAMPTLWARPIRSPTPSRLLTRCKPQRAETSMPL